MREICAKLRVTYSHQVVAAIHDVVTGKTCLQILGTNEVLRVAFGLRYQESLQHAGDTLITEWCLEILKAMLAGEGHTD